MGTPSASQSFPSSCILQAPGQHYHHLLAQLCELEVFADPQQMDQLVAAHPILKAQVRVVHQLGYQGERFVEFPRVVVVDVDLISPPISPSQLEIFHTACTGN
jgi:hypothetical protein